jgi:hypothetical protein
MWRDVYEGILGPLPENDYFARDFKRGSPAALGVYCVDSMLPVIPNLGAGFIVKAIKGAEANGCDATAVVRGKICE